MYVPPDVGQERVLVVRVVLAAALGAGAEAAVGLAPGGPVRPVSWALPTRQASQASRSGAPSGRTGQSERPSVKPMAAQYCDVVSDDRGRVERVVLGALEVDLAVEPRDRRRVGTAAAAADRRARRPRARRGKVDGAAALAVGCRGRGACGRSRAAMSKSSEKSVSLLTRIVSCSASSGSRSAHRPAARRLATMPVHVGVLVQDVVGLGVGRRPRPCRSKISGFCWIRRSMRVLVHVQQPLASGAARRSRSGRPCRAGSSRG